MHTGAWNQENLELRHWYNDQDLVRHMKTLAKNFKSFVNSHSDDKNIKFLVTNKSNNNGKGNQAAVIQIFQDGQLTDFHLNEISSKSTSSDKLESSFKPESLFNATTIRGNSTLITTAAKPDNRSGIQKQPSTAWARLGGTLTEPKRNSKTEQEQIVPQAEKVATIGTKPLFTGGHWKHPDTHSSKEARDVGGTEALSSTNHPFPRKAMAPPYLCRTQAGVVETPNLHPSQMILAEFPTFRSNQNKSEKSPSYHSRENDIVESPNLRPSQIRLGEFPSFRPKQNKPEKSPNSRSSQNDIVESPNVRPSQIRSGEFPPFGQSQNRACSIS